MKIVKSPSGTKLEESNSDTAPAIRHSSHSFYDKFTAGIRAQAKKAGDEISWKSPNKSYSYSAEFIGQPYYNEEYKSLSMSSPPNELWWAVVDSNDKLVLDKDKKYKVTISIEEVQ